MSFEFEKQSLEAHVVLCGDRFTDLQSQIGALDTKTSNIEQSVLDVKEMVIEMRDHRNNQLLRWSTAIIATLLSALGYVVKQMITKGHI